MNAQQHFRLSASQQAILIYLKSVGGHCSAGDCVRQTRGVHGYLDDLRFLQYVQWVDPLTIETSVTLTESGYDFLKLQFQTVPDDFDQTAQLIVPAFRGKNVACERDLVFIVMPFAKTFSPIYNAIKLAITDCEHRCEKADDIFSTQPILETVWEGLNRASLVISDLTGKNPNVFYETGIAHTLGKDVILIAQTLQDIPFDLRSFRYYEYYSHPDGLARLRQDLVAGIEDVYSQRSTLAEVKETISGNEPPI